jgi:hypothetical protein
MYGLSKTIIRVSHNEIYFFFKKYSICSLVLRISEKRLDTVFVYRFKSWSSEYEKGKYWSARVAAVRNGSTRFHKLFFYVCRCGSIRVGADESGIRCRSTWVERVKTVYYEVCIQGMQSLTAGFRTGSIRN